MGNRNDMNIIKFIESFPDENSCREHFRQIREQEGIVCKKCGCKKHYWLKAKLQWQCYECRFRTTLRSGTMMENYKLPIRKWYLAMAFMSFSKKGISAAEMQRQLDHSRYETIWVMMHRIREAMGNRDDRYELAGMVEFDEAYFETETSEKDKQNLKRGRGSQQQQNVAVAAESTPLEDLETGKKGKHCRYFKMKVLEGQSTEEINGFIGKNIAEESIVFTDKSTAILTLPIMLRCMLQRNPQRKLPKQLCNGCILQ